MSRSLRCGLAVAVVAAATVVVVPPAQARKPNAKAERFEKMARSAYGSKNFADAIASFEAAYDADPLPKFLFNIGRCHEKRGDLASAISYFERYLDQDDEAEDSEDVEAMAAVLEIKLRKKRSPVEVEVDPEGALVQWEGDVESGEGLAPTRRWLVFGSYEITASAEDHEPESKTIVVKPGEEISLVFSLSSSGLMSDSDADVSNAKRSGARRSAGGTNWTAYALLGGGVVLVAGGGVLGVMANQAAADRDFLVDKAQDGPVEFADLEEQHDAAHTRALTANILYGVGVLTVGVGAALLIAGGDDTQASLVPLDGGALLGVGGRL
jgi:hypothetical protein